MDTTSFNRLGTGISVMDTVMYWKVAVHSIVLCKGGALGAGLTGNCSSGLVWGVVRQ